MKVKTDELLAQLKIQGGNDYAYAAGYLCSLIEQMPSLLKLTDKQDRTLREEIHKHMVDMQDRNLRRMVRELKSDLVKLEEMV